MFLFNLLKIMTHKRGSMVFQRTEYDDGVYREDFYFNGVIERTEEYDYSYSPEFGSLHDWDRKTTYFNMQGQIEFHSIQYDNQSTYEAF